MKTLMVSLLSAALLTPTFAFADPGFSFIVTMSGKNNGKEQPTVTLKTVISGTKARIDIPIDKDDWKKGDYLVTTDAGVTYTLVSPSRKSYRTLDEATVKAMNEKENKGLSVADPVTSRTVTGANQEQFTRNYALSFRQGLVSGKGTIKEVHNYTLAEPSPSIPAFNPFINYTLMDLATLLLKNPTFASAGLSSALPKGFVKKAVLRLNSEIKAALIGDQKQESFVTLETSEITPTEVTPDLFTLPTDYKAMK